MVLNDSHWAPICRALGREQWSQDARFARAHDRVAHRTEINALVAGRIAEEDAGHWVSRLTTERVPFGLVNDYAQALADPQVAHRGLVREVEHPASGAIRLVGPPWISARSPVAVSPPPLLGQHTAEVLRRWLGMKDAEIAALA